MNRRDFLTTTALGLAVYSLPKGCTPSPYRTHRIGHTGITWGYRPEDAEAAIADVSSLGYHAFESFGHVLEYWDQRGGLKTLLDAAGLPLVAAYCPMNLTDPSKQAGEVTKMVRWGHLIKQAGGTVAVIGPDNVERASYDFQAHRSNIVAALNDIGRALDDIGVVGALHQHTGSCIETRDETYAIMEAVDTRYLKLCPDVGELYNGGVDPVQTITDFLSIIGHVHLKDYSGGAYNDGYCPVGQGQVDMAGCVEVLETADHDFMIMAELNPNPDNLPEPPLELARTSKAYLQTLGYTFRS